MHDRLVSLLQQFDLSAQVFHTGALCDQVQFDAADGVGFIHTLKQGQVTVETHGQARLDIQAPAVLFYLKPTSHRLIPSLSAGTELVCGSIDFGAGCENPLTQAVPSPLVIPLDGENRIHLTLELLFAEAFEDHCGRQAAMNRLCELLVIQLLRHLMDQGDIDVGVLAGLADPRLVKALNAMHDDPAHPWTLDSLAEKAGMSRARFAVNFRDTVGMTPGDYLTAWRLAMAQSLLRKGKPVNLIAHQVGYSGPAALARVFNARLGASPSQWLKQSRQSIT